MGIEIRIDRTDESIDDRILLEVPSGIVISRLYLENILRLRSYRISDLFQLPEIDIEIDLVYPEDLRLIDVLMIEGSFKVFDLRDHLRFLILFVFHDDFRFELLSQSFCVCFLFLRPFPFQIILLSSSDADDLFLGFHSSLFWHDSTVLLLSGMRQGLCIFNEISSFSSEPDLCVSFRNRIAFRNFRPTLALRTHGFIGSRFALRTSFGRHFFFRCHCNSINLNIGPLMSPLLNMLRNARFLI